MEVRIRLALPRSHARLGETITVVASACGTCSRGMRATGEVAALAGLRRARAASSARWRVRRERVRPDLACRRWLNIALLSPKPAYLPCQLLLPSEGVGRHHGAVRLQPLAGTQNSILAPLRRVARAVSRIAVSTPSIELDKLRRPALRIGRARNLRQCLSEVRNTGQGLKPDYPMAGFKSRFGWSRAPPGCPCPRRSRACHRRRGRFRSASTRDCPEPHGRP